MNFDLIPIQPESDELTKSESSLSAVAISAKRPPRLWSLPLDDRREFRIELSYFEDDGGLQENVVTQFAKGLAEGYQRLTSDEFGWKPWTLNVADRARSSRLAQIKLLRSSDLYGRTVNTDSGAKIQLNVQPVESWPEVEESRRSSVAHHELCHLFQFETPTYLTWPLKGFRGLGDPNCSMHEGTALAIEAAVSQRRPHSLPVLWQWVTRPEAALTSNPYGTHFFPLVWYLMERVGNSLPAKLYDVNAQDVPSMLAEDILNFVLRTRCELGRPLAAATGDDWFASRFCVETALLDDSESNFVKQVRACFRNRRIAKRFHELPILQFECPVALDHLGCCYFRLQTEFPNSNLCVEIRPADQRTGAIRFEALRCEVVCLDHEGRRFGEQLALDQELQNQRLRGVIPIDRKQVKEVLIVVANCGFGIRSEDYDQLRFRISIR